MRWLLVEPGRIGDWINSTVAAVKLSSDRGCSIDWVVRPEIKDLLPCSIQYNSAFFLPSSFNPPALIKLLIQLRSIPYDGVCILSPGKSGWLVAKSLRARVKMGYLGYPNYTTATIIHSHGRNQQRREYRFLEDHLLVRAMKSIDCDMQLQYPEIIRNDAHHPKIHLQAGFNEGARDTLRGLGINIDRSFAVLHPWSRWEHKQWIPERWSELVAALVKLKVQVLIGSGPHEVHLAKEIADKHGPSAFYSPRIIPLPVYAAILSQAGLVIAADSAAMHLAAALGTPLVALFGPTSPKLSGPVGNGGKIAIVQTEISLPCQPCSFPSEDTRGKGCHEGHRACMATLETNAVLRAIDSLKVFQMSI